jgi:hypothetical protein
MTLAGHQFPRAFAVALGTSAAHEAPVVQEESEQFQIRTTQIEPRRICGRRVGLGQATIAKPFIFS